MRQFLSILRSMKWVFQWTSIFKRKLAFIQPLVRQGLFVKGSIKFSLVFDFVFVGFFVFVFTVFLFLLFVLFFIGWNETLVEFLEQTYRAVISTVSRKQASVQCSNVCQGSEQDLFVFLSSFSFAFVRSCRSRSVLAQEGDFIFT